ncbi:hypothetical protein IGI04_040088 [Brassica rapa subsp. trilocularis]|uniref:DDE-1 domain-containing protein n=1 Tax=Brassica rapa subsp. trilocularis TaxID=1813537 RepID=A0ABQ7KNG4_BRACM|nr:hypothetical protein IGI04_040088 [Brassica rapa subsp. trilocularis]
MMRLSRFSNHGTNVEEALLVLGWMKLALIFPPRRLINCKVLIQGKGSGWSSQLCFTRFEYANMFHTVTDWYSAYVSSRVTGSPNRPHVVFIDGHCTTQLEETWTGLFSGIRYAKNFTKPVCFLHTILSPLGYETALFNGLSGEIDCNGESAHSLWLDPDNTKTARLSEVVSLLKCLR